MNSSSIYSMYLQNPQAKNFGSLSNRTAVKAGKGTSVPLFPHARNTLCNVLILSLVLSLSYSLR